MTEPPVDTVLSRVLTHGIVDADLSAETAWLLVHTLDNVAASATALACRGGVVQALCWCLETAVGDCGPQEQERLVAMRDRWLREGIHAWERCVGHQGQPTAALQSNSKAHVLSSAAADEAMRDRTADSSDDQEDSDMEDSNMEGSLAGQKGVDQCLLWVADATRAQDDTQAAQLQNTNPDASLIGQGNEGSAVLGNKQGCCSNGEVHGGTDAPPDRAMKGAMDTPVTERSDREYGQQQHQQQQLCSGQPKWGLQLDTALTGTSEMHEQSLLATSQLSVRTFSTSEGLDGGSAGGAMGGVEGQPAGSDVAGKSVAGAQSCMASEAEQNAQYEAPIRSLVRDTPSEQQKALVMLFCCRQKTCGTRHLVLVCETMDLIRDSKKAQ